MKDKAQGQRIRNGIIRRDFKRLLTLLASADLSNSDAYSEVEHTATRHALRFDDVGNVKETQ